MAELKIPYSETISMTSSWKCKEIERVAKSNKNVKIDDEGNPVISYTGTEFNTWEIDGKPSYTTSSASFSYSFTSGTKIKSVVVWAKIGSGGGISILTANGSYFNKTNGDLRGASLPANSISGSNTLNVTFAYRAAGKIFKDTNYHYSNVNLSNIYVQVEYEGSAGSTAQKSSGTQSGLTVPPQSVCIYDNTDGSIYMFDGVTKVQHKLSMDVQEEVDASKNKNNEYVNNAKNKPDELTLDVIMSDVYTGGGSILGSNAKMTTAMQNAIEKTGSKLIRGYQGRTRSELAFYTLHWLKEERRPLTVITPQYVHTDMIIVSVTVNHEETTPYGWEGQIGFQHKYNPKKKDESKSKASDGTGIPSESMLAQIMNSF